MAHEYAARVPLAPLLEPVELPPLVRWQMALADARSGWRRPIRRLVKASFRLVHQRLGVPAKGRLRLRTSGKGRVFTVDMANTAYLQTLLAERNGGLEPELAALLTLLADRLGTVYDIGANCGLFSARLLAAPGFVGQIHAFEMIPATCRSMTRMFEQCGMADRVVCHPFGVSAADGNRSVQLGMHSTLARVVADGRGNIAVQVRALDGLRLPTPDLIKIDVEGHEDSVLSGAVETLSHAHPHVVFESWYAPSDVEAMTAPFERLAAHGYRFFALSAEGSHAAGTRLRLKPVTPGARKQIPDQLNILAVHEERLVELAAIFEQAGEER
jgi:FkbM family methyltransferase